MYIKICNGLLNKIPSRSEYRLLVLRNNVALNKHRKKVAILPNLSKINLLQFVLGFINVVQVSDLFH